MFVGRVDVFVGRVDLFVGRVDLFVGRVVMYLLESCDMFVIGYKRHHIIPTRFGIHYHNKHITHN